MKTIKIDLDGDLNKTIDEIEELLDQIETFPQSVAVEGAVYAEERYRGYTANTANGNTVGYGKAPVYVQAEPSERKTGGAVIHAVGEEVCFAEWGTGRWADSDPKAPVPTGYGSYSATHGQHLLKHGYWHYNGVLHYGSYPTYAMTYTVEFLRDHTINLAKEHFK